MRAYVATSGVIFGLLVVAHLTRVIAEGAHLARDPWFLLVTVAAGTLSFWAVQVFRMTARPR